ncbi:MAG: FAD-dependent monooxygenase [Streptosporangiaceae bacterium]
MSTSARLEIVVAGAGPTGLLAACELARRGVGFRIIDKLAVPTTESRAIVVHARSLEMLDRVGAVGAIIDSGIKTLAMRMQASGRPLAHVDLQDVDSAFPYSVTTAQTETERVLTERLRELGGSIERGVTLTALTQDPDAVHLTLQHDNGAREQVDAAFVVGADGAHSTVRTLVGTRLEGSFQGERFLMGDVEADHHLDPASMYTYFAPEGPLLVFPMRGSRMRLIAQIHPTSERPVNLSPTQDELQKIVDERAGGIAITRSHWLTGFEIHHAQVPAYRFGRVFLAGDAAHVHSPAGGQGMNTGMQDSFNLAWKLALAARGRGGEALLNSYHAERHPIAADVIKFSTALTKIATVRGELPIRLRNEVAHAISGFTSIQHAMAAKTEEIAVAYLRSPIIAGKQPRHARLCAGQHEAHLPDAAVREQLRFACGSASTGHAILTIAGPSGLPAPVLHDGAVSVLVTGGQAPAPGYGLTVTDPERTAAERYGLRAGGRVVIRPDGYIGLITGLDDDIASYFSKLTA